MLETSGGSGMIKFVTLSILLLSLMGCSKDSIFQGMADDDNRKAAIEEAAIAIDDRDYDTAISGLVEIYNTTDPDPEVSRLLGSAYMGKAGIDVTNLIDYSYDADSPYFNMGASSLSLALSPPPKDASQLITDTECNVQDLTVLMTTSGAQYINAHCIGDIIDYLDKAKRAFHLLHQADRQTSDDTIQYGIASAVHFVTALGKATADSLNRTLVYGPDQPYPNPTLYKPYAVPIPIDMKAYNLLRYHLPWGISVSSRWTHVSSHTLFMYAYSPQLDDYKDDLYNIHNAVTAFDSVVTKDNTVRNELDDFLRDVLQNPEGDITDYISTMTTNGIFEYIEIISAQ